MSLGTRAVSSRIPPFSENRIDGIPQSGRGVGYTRTDGYGGISFVLGLDRYLCRLRQAHLPSCTLQQADIPPDDVEGSSIVGDQAWPTRLKYCGVGSGPTVRLAFVSFPRHS